MDRTTINAVAARELAKYIQMELQISVRAFAKRVGVPLSSLRSFLANGSGNSNAPRHTRGPYEKTLRPILAAKLPDNLREKLLDVIYYEDRVVRPKLGV